MVSLSNSRRVRLGFDTLEDRTCNALADPFGAGTGEFLGWPVIRDKHTKILFNIGPNVTQQQADVVIKSVNFWNSYTRKRMRNKGATEKTPRGVFFQYTSDPSAHVTFDTFHDPNTRVLGFCQTSFFVIPVDNTKRLNIVHADIRFNTAFTFNYEDTPALPLPSNPPVIDFQSVVEHEFGHSLGQNHDDGLYPGLNNTGRSVLFTFYQRGFTQRAPSINVIGTKKGEFATGVVFQYLNEVPKRRFAIQPPPLGTVTFELTY